MNIPRRLAGWLLALALCVFLEANANAQEPLRASSATEPIELPSASRLGSAVVSTTRSEVSLQRPDTQRVIQSDDGLTPELARTLESEQRVRGDVAFCVAFVKRDSPSFDVVVRPIDPTTGELRIDRLNADPRSESAFARCRMAIVKWRLVEQYLPKTADPTPPAAPPDNRFANHGISPR